MRGNQSCELDWDELLEDDGAKRNKWGRGESLKGGMVNSGKRTMTYAMTTYQVAYSRVEV